MNKLIAVALFALLSVVNARVKGGIYSLKDHSDFKAQTDNFITAKLLQYKHVLDSFDAKLQEFDENYNERLESVTINREFLVKNLININKHFDPMEVLSDFTRECVVKYRSDIPSVEVIKTAVTKCRTNFSKQLDTLLKHAVSTRKVLAGYIETFKANVKACGDNLLCVINTTEKTNSLVISAEKDFQIQKEAAECTAKANIESAINCSYNVEYRTHSLIAKAEVQIELCLTGQDECKPCEEYTCSESYDLQANVKNETIVNPFFERSDIPQCLMLNVNKN